MRTISPEQLITPNPLGYTPAVVGEAWATAHRALRAELADPEVQTVLVMVGSPGSGKSAWLREQPELEHVVAFDAVFAQRARRAAIARRIRDAGKSAIAVFVTCPLSLAIARNAARPPYRCVPEGFLRASWAELQEWPPALAEGWSEILHVPGSDVRADRRTTEEADRRAGRVAYRWRTKGDGKVRPEHEARHGLLFSWNYPPEGGHPGEDHGCRCTAEMVNDLDVVETREGVLRARPLTVPAWARRR